MQCAVMSCHAVLCCVVLMPTDALCPAPRRLRPTPLSLQQEICQAK